MGLKKISPPSGYIKKCAIPNFTAKVQKIYDICKFLSEKIHFFITFFSKT